MSVLSLACLVANVGWVPKAGYWGGSAEEKHLWPSAMHAVDDLEPIGLGEHP